MRPPTPSSDGGGVTMVQGSALVATDPDVLDWSAVLAAGSKSFSFASRFLPVEAREDAAVVYAFCRYVDDAVDDATNVDVAREAIERLHGQIRGRRRPDAVVEAFLSVASRRGIRLEYAEELVTGVGSDLDTVRVQDDAELVRYGYRVAGTVGLLMCPILGVSDEAALPFAIDLGVGMQITNICRDVAEDAEMGRVYLPRERLARYGVSPEMLVAFSVHDSRELRRAIANVVVELVELADTYYQSGCYGMAFIPVRPRMAIRVARRVYQGIGQKLVRCGADPWRGRTVLGGWAKVFCAARALVEPWSLGHLRYWSCPPEHRAELHTPLAGLPGANCRALSEVLTPGPSS